MNEQCKYLNDPLIDFVGQRGFKCNLPKGLQALKAQFDGEFNIRDLKALACESGGDPNCPAFKSIVEAGRNSQYSRVSL